MNKYILDSELSSVAKMGSGSMAYPILKLADIYLSFVYKCLNKDKDIHYQIIKFNGFRIFVIIPNNLKEENHPCIINYHGGAFVYRGWNNHFLNLVEYAKKTNSITIYTDYRLAYNTEYGATLKDCIDTYEWVITHAKDYHIDLNKIILSGDSAGGYLTLKVNEYIHDHSLVKPLSLMLIYPVVDTSLTTESMKKYNDTPVWNALNNKKMWEIYLKGNNEESFLDKDLSYIKNCYIEITEFDCLHDEGFLLYEKIKNNGNVILNDTKKTCHGYDIDINLNIVKTAIKIRTDFINTCINKI